MIYHIPGKTFLLGEYAALVGGSVLGLATSPGFEVSYQTGTHKDQNIKSAFPSGSPAAMAHKDRPDLQIKFVDLVKLGGFGKSTAEYLSVILPDLIQSSDFSTLKNQYKKIAESSGSAVSGLDLAIQLYGEVMHFDGATNSCTTSSWQFPKLEFFLISTGVKIKTHEHLQQINLLDLKDFPQVADRLIQQCLIGDETDLVAAVNEWSLFLASRKLVHEHSVNLQAALLKNKEILAAKPCGALGADVILVLCAVEKASHVKAAILNMGLSVVASSKDLCPGVLAQLGKLKSAGLDVG